MLREGVDPKREHEALLALNQGAAEANKGDFAAADKSLQRALELWEALASRRQAPPQYRANLAMTLNDLGWIRLRQSRKDEAEAYYSRTVVLADELKNDPVLDEKTKKTLAGARSALSALRGEKSATLVDEKDKAAIRKYEEAEVSDAKEGPRAEGLYREAIAAWEEILPQATNREYTTFAVARLTEAYIRLGDLQERLGKRSESEASLKKAIDYGQRSVDLEPGRPLAKHNLDIARRMLDGLREQVFEEEINKLTRAQRFSDAVDVFTRGIKEQDDRVRAGKGLETAVPSLAYRLNRLAWLLAHCPDKRVRDAKAAIEHARRATSLRSDVADYWYTLAMAQYRHGDWRDSLVSLDTLKAKQGEAGASDMVLSGMNLFRLNRKDEARAALKQAVRLMDEINQKAAGDALLRMEFELMRPAVEALLMEAQKLMNGDPADSRTEA